MKRRDRWLLLALALLALVYLLASGTQSLGTRRRTRQAPQFPRPYEGEHVERLRRNRTLPPRAVDAGAADQDVVVLRKRDPLLVALPPDASSIVVFEAKALYDTPAAKMLLACLDESGELEELQQSGLQLSDIERVAVAESPDGSSVVVLAGPVAKDASRLPAREDGAARSVRAWNDELIVVGENPRAVDEAIARLEGRRGDGQAIEERESYGDIYGRVSRDDARRMMRGAVPEDAWPGDVDLGFHVDANRDVLLVLDAQGERGLTQDLGKALGAAIAARRVQAVMQDEHELAELLDFFEVDLGEEGFSIDAALPIEFVEQMMGECARQARERDPASGKGAAGAGP